jgi:Mrp family chromosome partitioning ATPase
MMMHSDVRDTCAEGFGVAHRLRDLDRRVVGIVAVRDDIDVPPVAFSLAVALAQLSDGAIACVDATAHWALPASLRTGIGDVASRSEYKTWWLSGSLALIAPERAVRAGDAPRRLAAMVEGWAARFDFMLIDLTGLDRAECASAAELMHGVVAIARAGKTSARAVVRLRRQLPASTPFGVILVGT